MTFNHSLAFECRFLCLSVNYPLHFSPHLVLQTLMTKYRDLMRYPFVKVVMLFKHMSPFTWYVLGKRWYSGLQIPFAIFLFLQWLTFNYTLSLPAWVCMNHGGKIPVHGFSSHLYFGLVQVRYHMTSVRHRFCPLYYKNVCILGSPASPGHACHNHLCTTEWPDVSPIVWHLCCFHSCQTLPALPARHHTGPSGTVASAFSFCKLQGEVAYSINLESDPNHAWGGWPHSTVSFNIILLLLY